MDNIKTVVITKSRNKNSWTHDFLGCHIDVQIYLKQMNVYQLADTEHNRKLFRGHKAESKFMHYIIGGNKITPVDSSTYDNSSLAYLLTNKEG
jgi:hypothetical protein